MNIYDIVGRHSPLFKGDLENYGDQIDEIIKQNNFLVIGGGGSIGQAVTKQLFQRSPRRLHVVDLSENYLAELVRDIRSSFGYSTDDFDTFAIDCGTEEFEDFFARGKYDYILNLSAMKHVRSENDPFSMYRMMKVNIFNAMYAKDLSEKYGAKKYFCVSTDKAANPANFMGATKRAMEIAIMRTNSRVKVSGARFANVAFSNGSLLQGFEMRMRKRQPLSTPSDIKRFFVTEEESGLICLFSALLGETNEILFPYNEREISLKSFYEIACEFLKLYGKQPVICSSEAEARNLMGALDLDKYWPLNVFHSDTVGEKPFEEFYTDKEDLILGKFQDLAAVRFHSSVDELDIQNFQNKIKQVNLSGSNASQSLIRVLNEFVPTFQHRSGNKYLNARM